jgi:hypothetical protein
MMIALAILAMGLLVIGAALPIGIRYTRTSVNIATGEAAAEYALDLIEQSVCIQADVWDQTNTVQSRQTGLFLPRDPNGDFNPNYEPIIKVRPLLSTNIAAAPGFPQNEVYPGYGVNRGVVVEDYVARWYADAGGGVAGKFECDSAAPGWWLWPVVPVVNFIYPPIETTTWGDPNSYFLYPGPYERPLVSQVDRAKVAAQRTSWVAFYRRVSYADGSDPFLYEFIVVTVRLPSARHRFPVQNPATLGYLADADCAVPVPWMVVLASVPRLTPNTDYMESWDPAGHPHHYLLSGFRAPGTLRLGAASSDAPLIPVGSIVVPARNDRVPDAFGQPGNSATAGFVPSSLDTLPIYEVVDRVETTTGYDIIVKDNGFYPWLAAGFIDPINWPVWVIPPAFEELSSGQPVFPNRSPIVAVARRYVRLREVP